MSHQSVETTILGSYEETRTFCEMICENNGDLRSGMVQRMRITNNGIISMAICKDLQEIIAKYLGLVEILHYIMLKFVNNFNRLRF